MNQTKNFDFSIRYQRILIHRIVRDKRYAAVVIDIIRPEIFDTEPLRWCCKKILLGLRSIRILVSELKKERDSLNENLKSAIASELKGFMADFDEEDSNYALTNVREFVASQTIGNCLFKAATRASEGAKSEELRGILEGAILSTVHSPSIVVDPIETMPSRFQERERAYNEGEFVYASSGFKHIDDDIRGPGLGQMWSYFGDTNIGKSHVAIAAGIRNTVQGIHVVHFSIEDDINITLQRYDACLTHIPHENQVRMTDEERERMQKVHDLLMKKRKGYLRLVKLEEGSNINAVYSELDRLRVKESFIPKAVIIDSPYDMQELKKMENFRLSQTQIYRELHDFCARTRVALIVLDQSNQESKGKTGDTGAVSESYGKARIVDGMFTINQTKLQKKDGLVELFSAKMRDREKHKSYFIRPNLKISRFTIIERRTAYGS